LELNPEEGGVCYTVGGSRFVILSAGYLGSLAWGGLILVMASRTRYDRHIALVLGAVTVFIGLVFARPLYSFGYMFALVAGLFLIASGWFLPDKLNDIVLRTIGLTSCLYATLDIKSDVIDRSETKSDARMLAEYTHTKTLFWGFLWIGIAICASAYLVLLSCKPLKHRGDPNWDLPPPAFDMPRF